MGAKIIPALTCHAIRMAPKTRLEDRNELWAAAQIDAFNGILESMRCSPGTCATLMIDDEPACIFGCSYLSDSGHTGVPWMVGTDLLVQNAKVFMQLCPTWVDKMRNGCKMLENYVDARNTVAIRWLKKLGFKFDEAAPYGPLKLPFHRFTMEGKN